MQEWLHDGTSDPVPVKQWLEIDDREHQREETEDRLAPQHGALTPPALKLCRMVEKSGAWSPFGGNYY